MNRRNAISALAALSSAGCAVTPPAKEAGPLTPAPEPFSLLFPADNPSLGSDGLTVARALNLFRFPNHHKVAAGPSPDIDALRWDFQENDFQVERYKALRGSLTGGEILRVSVGYRGPVRLDVRESVAELSLAPVHRSRYAESGPWSGRPLYEVRFELEDLAAAIARTELNWRLEIDSAHNSEATYANFARLLRRVPVALSDERDPVTGRIFRSRFSIRTNSLNAFVLVDVFPYRSASKVIAATSLPCAVQGHRLDFVSAATAFQQEIARVVRA